MAYAGAAILTGSTAGRPFISNIEMLGGLVSGSAGEFISLPVSSSEAEFLNDAQKAVSATSAVFTKAVLSASFGTNSGSIVQALNKVMAVAKGGAGDVIAGSNFTTAGVIMACNGDDKTIDEPGTSLTTNGHSITINDADGLTVGANGNEFTITESSDNVTLKSTVEDKDIIFNVNTQGTGDQTIMTLDGSAGALLMASGKRIQLGASQEAIYGDGTDIHFEVGANGDINIPSDIGLTFAADEKIESDGTELAITAGAALNVSARIVNTGSITTNAAVNASDFSGTKAHIDAANGHAILSGSMFLSGTHGTTEARVTGSGGFLNLGFPGRTNTTAISVSGAISTAGAITSTGGDIQAAGAVAANTTLQAGTNLTLGAAGGSSATIAMGSDTDLITLEDSEVTIAGALGVTSVRSTSGMIAAGTNGVHTYVSGTELRLMGSKADGSFTSWALSVSGGMLQVNACDKV